MKTNPILTKRMIELINNGLININDPILNKYLCWRSFYYFDKTKRKWIVEEYNE